MNITKHEGNLLTRAIEVQLQALKRKANTEKNEQIKEICQKEIHEFTNLSNKIFTMELPLNETTISKQGK